MLLVMSDLRILDRSWLENHGDLGLLNSSATTEFSEGRLSTSELSQIQLEGKAFFTAEEALEYSSEGVGNTGNVSFHKLLSLPNQSSPEQHWAGFEGIVVLVVRDTNHGGLQWSPGSDSNVFSLGYLTHANQVIFFIQTSFVLLHPLVRPLSLPSLFSRVPFLNHSSPFVLPQNLGWSFEHHVLCLFGEAEDHGDEAILMRALHRVDYQKPPHHWYDVQLTQEEPTFPGWYRPACLPLPAESGMSCKVFASFVLSSSSIHFATVSLATEEDFRRPADSPRDDSSQPTVKLPSSTPPGGGYNTWTPPPVPSAPRVSTGGGDVPAWQVRHHSRLLRDDVMVS